MTQEAASRRAAVWQDMMQIVLDGPYVCSTSAVDALSAYVDAALTRAREEAANEEAAKHADCCVDREEVTRATLAERAISDRMAGAIEELIAYGVAPHIQRGLENVLALRASAPAKEAGDD